MTVQAELPIDFNHFSTLVQRKTNFVLSQTRLNALNRECLSFFHQDISPSFYHVQKPKSYLRPNINNLGNECIDPNISAENRQRSVQWITTELKAQTSRNLPGRASHIENRVYDRFAKQGQFLFRFIHQYYTEIRKEINSFILQSRKEPQILELLDPQTSMPNQTTQADMKPQISSLIQHNTQPTPPPTPTSTPGISQTPGGIKLPPGITIQAQPKKGGCSKASFIDSACHNQDRKG
jgi:hypothetical protein